MTPSGSHRPLFEGLVYSEDGELAETAYVGGEAQYVILDAGFRVHQTLIWMSVDTSHPS